MTSFEKINRLFSILFLISVCLASIDSINESKVLVVFVLILPLTLYFSSQVAQFVGEVAWEKTRQIIVKGTGVVMLTFIFVLYIDLLWPFIEKSEPGLNSYVLMCIIISILAGSKMAAKLYYIMNDYKSPCKR